jgi:putative transposase
VLRSRYRFLGNDAPYFMTMTVNHWLPIFTRPETVEIVLDSWRYLQANEE